MARFMEEREQEGVLKDRKAAESPITLDASNGMAEYEKRPTGAEMTMYGDMGAAEVPQKMTTERVKEAMQTLLKYKAGKANLEKRVKETEVWWKRRHWEWMNNRGNVGDVPYTSAWLFNSIINRHADAIQSFPQPNILPREPGDKEVARQLTEIVPCILEQNNFEEVYSEVAWQKMKQGTGIYGVFWDSDKLGGLGDITIRKIDVLNLFWEPGISDIQDSRNVFLVTPTDIDLIEGQYPELKGKLKGREFTLTEYLYDDKVSMDGKCLVVDWYYHTYEGGVKKLQYCKFVGDTVLYASEDDNEQPMEERTVTMGTDMETGEPYNQTTQVPVGMPVAEEGWYAHGEYPFVFDALFPVEGSPCGFGYVDVNKSAQEQIDLMNQAVVKNCLIAATPRFFVREDGGVNESEFADITRPFVHVNANLGDDCIREISANGLSGNYITILNNKITELKETSNNTDASNGITSGVTAASGIAAQQEAAGKTSRASTMSAYRAFAKIINQVLELIAQFYNVQRQFRITGQNGDMQFTSFDNRGMVPQPQGIDFDVDMGLRKPVFDVKVSAQSKTVYTQNAQNELAISLANMGVFNPQMVDQSLLLLDAMDFAGKEAIEQKISEAGTMQQMFAQVSQIALQLAQQYAPDVAEELSAIIMQREGVSPMMAAGGAPMNVAGENNTSAIKTAGGGAEESTQVKNARARAAQSAEVAG